MSEAVLSELSVYRAKPTVRVDEQEFSKLSELLIALEVKEQEGGLSSLEMRLSNVASDTEAGASLAFEDESVVKLGSNITIYSGDENQPTEIFRGIVTGIEAIFPMIEPPEIIVLAEDVLQKSRMARRIADLSQRIATNLGLTPQVTGFTESMGTWYQFNESDLMFLRRVLHRYDGDLQIIGDELFVYPRSEMQRDLLELALYGQLREVKIMADLAHQVSEVTVSGWDVTNGSRIRVTSSGQNAGPGEGRTGSEILTELFGARSEHIGHLGVANTTEAEALANAAYDQTARRFVCVEGTAEGNPSLRVGTHVRLTGISDRFNNTYYVVSARHRFDLTVGYETDFEAESSRLEYA
ncbi:MAG: hypothetical protein OEX07_05675 [Gammaproteobacteria bacterium]|nr:hypothetical protein [Gammaproteobacteria bacterium]